MATTRRPESPQAAHPSSPRPVSTIASSPGPADELRCRGRDAQGAEVEGSWLAVEGSLPAGNAAGEKKPTEESQPDEAKTTKKPGAFVRVWSEADELRILECLAAHVKKHSAPPVRSQLLGVLAGRGLEKEEFTVTEIYEKVRRLRIQYEKMLSAPRPVPDDIGEGRKRFELSRAIWGKPIAPAPTAPAKSAEKLFGSTRGCRELEELRRLYPDLVDAVERISTSERGGKVGDVLKRGLEFIDDGTAVYMNAMAKEQRVLELKSMMKLDDMRKEVIRTLFNIMD